MRYAAKSIDRPDDGNGEFFVFWFDALEGSEASSHANNVPNLGLHTDGAENRFMVRYRSDQQQFGDVLVGDQDYLIVGRLSKSRIGQEERFDRLEMWVNPEAEDAGKPHLKVTNDQAIADVSWVGFSTGAKTEIGDEIVISRFRLGRSWAEIMDLPSEPNSDSVAMQAANRTVQFNRDILPVLEKHCFECHQDNLSDTDLELYQFDQVLNHVTPFKATQSEL